MWVGYNRYDHVSKTKTKLGTFEDVILVGFFQDLCEFVIHCNKRHIFFFFLFFLLTITGRNEAIIVELK